MTEAVLDWDEDLLKQICKEAIENKSVTPSDLLTMIGNIMGIIGQKFEEGEYFLPELIGASATVKEAIDAIIEPAILASGKERKSQGKVVLGTVEGDVHSIGKDLVAAFLFSSGFEVFNLGVEVPAGEFIKKAEEVKADAIGLSALLSMSIGFQKQVIEEFTKRGVRNKYKIVVGGSPTSHDWADEIGADGWADDAIGAVELFKELIPKKL